MISTSGATPENPSAAGAGGGGGGGLVVMGVPAGHWDWPAPAPLVAAMMVLPLRRRGCPRARRALRGPAADASSLPPEEEAEAAGAVPVLSPFAAGVVGAGPRWWERCPVGGLGAAGEAVFCRRPVVRR